MAPKSNTPPDPQARATAAAAGTTAEPETVTVADLPAALAKVDSADEVRRMKAADDRSTAQPVYDARIEELEPADEDQAEPEKAKPAGRAARTARTRVKYDGNWYGPGDTVPFARAKDAEPYDKARALEPARK